MQASHGSGSSCCGVWTLGRWAAGVVVHGLSGLTAYAILVLGPGIKPVAPLASIRQMSRQVSRGSAGEYQADEQAGVARLRWRVSGR